MRRLVSLFLISALLMAALPGVQAATAPSGVATGLALVDPTTATWYLIHPDGTLTSFRYGIPGDVPLLGDWDCDGIATPAMFRPSSGYVYLSNRNVTAVAETEFFFGIPGWVIGAVIVGLQFLVLLGNRDSDGLVFLVKKSSGLTQSAAEGG